ncbi:hypothetical protein [Streptomyces sp. JNUCC 63]
MTTAAVVFAAAGIGAAAGQGRIALAVPDTVLALPALETRHLSMLRLLDGRRWAHRFNDDEVILARTSGRTSEDTGSGH